MTDRFRTRLAAPTPPVAYGSPPSREPAAWLWGPAARPRGPASPTAPAGCYGPPRRLGDDGRAGGGGRTGRGRSAVEPAGPQHPPRDRGEPVVGHLRRHAPGGVVGGPVHLLHAQRPADHGDPE